MKSPSDKLKLFYLHNWFLFLILQASLTLDESNLNASNHGDISADDNAVDLPIKPEDESSATGLSNNSNERIPILDDDDDVIVLPQEEPIITEIPDDDDHEAKEAASKECSNSQADAGHTPLDESAPMVTSQDTGVVSQSDNERGGDDADADEGLLNYLSLVMLFFLNIILQRKKMNVILISFLFTFIYNR